MIEHIKDKGHAWLIGLVFVTLLAYVLRALSHGVTENELVTNVTLTVFTAGSAFGGLMSLLVLAATSKKDCGELAELRSALVLGLIGGVAIASIKLLNLFGVI
jgi:hypothetical protein